jgi:predicted nucleic acid-binding protein
MIVLDTNVVSEMMRILDGQIASIAWSNGCSVATRNVQDFLDCGVEVINPFGSFL